MFYQHYKTKENVRQNLGWKYENEQEIVPMLCYSIEIICAILEQ